MADQHEQPSDPHQGNAPVSSGEGSPLSLARGAAAVRLPSRLPPAGRGRIPRNDDLELHGALPGAVDVPGGLDGAVALAGAVDVPGGLDGATDAELVALVSGTGTWTTGGVERLGMPPLRASDGPVGVRADGPGARPSFLAPCGASLGATWDTDLVAEVAATIGAEARRRGVDLLLAPTINLARYALSGRHFECLSEDPHLTASIAVSYVRAVQEQGVACVAKHFVCNDAEHRRHTVSCEVDERALREIYLHPFEALVRAGVRGIMTAYNRVNGTHASEHRELLLDILKGEWSFPGVVVSDWWGTCSTDGAAVNGLDIEMPGPPMHWGDKLLAAVADGRVARSVLHDKARRIRDLHRWLARVRAERPGPEGPSATGARPGTARSSLARRAAAAGSVLLSNTEGGLPWARDDVTSVAVIGPSSRWLCRQGGGSARVRSDPGATLAEALSARLGSGVRIEEAPGCRVEGMLAELGHRLLSPAGGSLPGRVTVEYFDGLDAAGTPVAVSEVSTFHLRWLRRPVAGVGECYSIRMRASVTSPANTAAELGLVATGDTTLRVDGVELLGTSDAHRGAAFYGTGSAEVRGRLQLQAAVPVEVEVTFRSRPGSIVGGIRVGCMLSADVDEGELLAQACAAAARADRCVVVVGTDDQTETEGRDRVSMHLPGAQDRLVAAVAEVNPSAVVVVNAGAPVAMPWADRVAAVLLVWFPGEAAEEAVADMLVGDAEPGGRLPVTIPRAIEDAAVRPAEFAGETVTYTETGRQSYRARRSGASEAFPFGHGLGYTSTTVGPVSVVEPWSAAGPPVVEVAVSNTGRRAGTEVVQVYARPAEVTGGPEAPVAGVPTLVGFAKLRLEPGEKRAVRIRVDTTVLRHWDPAACRWRYPQRVVLTAGRSAREAERAVPAVVVVPTPGPRSGAAEREIQPREVH